MSTTTIEEQHAEPAEYPGGVLDPEKLLRLMHGKILDRRPRNEYLWGYYDGDQPLAFASRKFLDVFGGVFRAFADSWCDLVVDAVEERLNVEGFRFGDGETGDQEAWRIWQYASMDLESQLATTEGLVTGAAYATTWFGDGDDPEITVEPADNAYVMTDPRNRRHRTAGLRVYLDDWGFEHAELWTPSELLLCRTDSPAGGRSLTAEGARWVPDIEADPRAEPDGIFAKRTNPLGRVAIVPIENKPRLSDSRLRGTNAQSELIRMLPVQDAVNLLVADMMIAAEFAAMPQRWATGLEPAIDPTTNQEVDPMTGKHDFRLWVFPGGEEGEQGPRFGQFEAANLDNYVKAVGMLVEHIASQTRTPPHYLRASADRLSGESLRAAETGLVAKARRKQRFLGEAWEEVMRLAFAVKGDAARAADYACETIWGDPESRTESQHVDALVKLKELDVPTTVLWERVPFSQTEIVRMKAERARETMLRAVGLAAADRSDIGDEVDDVDVELDLAPA